MRRFFLQNRIWTLFPPCKLLSLLLHCVWIWLGYIWGFSFPLGCLSSRFVCHRSGSRARAASGGCTYCSPGRGPGRPEPTAGCESAPSRVFTACRGNRTRIMWSSQPTLAARSGAAGWGSKRRQPHSSRQSGRNRARSSS